MDIRTGSAVQSDTPAQDFAARRVPSLAAEALALGRQGRYADALALARRALDRSLQLQRNEQAAAALDVIGLNLCALGEHAAAIDAYDEARRLHAAAQATPAAGLPPRGAVTAAERVSMGATVAHQAQAWAARADVLRDAGDDAGAGLARQRVEALAGAACSLLGDTPATPEHAEAVHALVRVRWQDGPAQAASLRVLGQRIETWLGRPLVEGSMAIALLQLCLVMVEVVQPPAQRHLPRAAAMLGAVAGVRDPRLTVGDLALLQRELAWRIDEAAGRYAEALAGQQAWAKALQRERAAIALERSRWARQGLAAWRAEAEEFVTHDLRAPLAVALTQMQALSGESVTSEVHERLHRSSHSVQRAIDIADQYLIVIRAEHLQRADLGLLNLGELADDVCEQMAPPAGAEVHLERDICWDLFVHGDRILLMRALANLLSNAFKHAPAGTTVRVALAAEGADVRLSVSDQGAGLPLDMRARLFQRHATGAVRNGNGLGLAMVARVARLHEAHISVDSEPGRGTCVSLVMTAVPTPPVAAGRGPGASSASSGSGFEHEPG